MALALNGDDLAAALVMTGARHVERVGAIIDICADIMVREHIGRYGQRYVY
jgi:hypothetical protein